MDYFDGRVLAALKEGKARAGKLNNYFASLRGVLEEPLSPQLLQAPASNFSHKQLKQTRFPT